MDRILLRGEQKGSLGIEVHSGVQGQSPQLPEITVENKTEEIDENTQIMPFTS